MSGLRDKWDFFTTEVKSMIVMKVMVTVISVTRTTLLDGVAWWKKNNVLTDQKTVSELIGAILSFGVVVSVLNT